MLREFANVRQIDGESKRRWFADEYFDLIVWLNDREDIIGFELCYDISRTHRALIWRQDTGYSHHRVDDGEHRPGKMKASPILMSDGRFDHIEIAEKFQHATQQIEPKISTFVYEKLLQYPHL
jgi:hypothetical protein